MCLEPTSTRHHGFSTSDKYELPNLFLTAGRTMLNQASKKHERHLGSYSHLIIFNLQTFFHKTVFAQCISPFFYLTNQPLCIFDGSQGQNMSSRPQPGHPPGRSSGTDLPRGASEYHWHHHPPQWSAEFRNLRRERTWIQDIQDIQVPPCLAMTMWDPRKSGLLTFKTSPFQCFPQEDRSSIDVPRLQVLLFSRPSKDGLFYRSFGASRLTKT